MRGFIDQVWGKIGWSAKVLEGVRAPIGPASTFAAIFGRTRDVIPNVVRSLWRQRATATNQLRSRLEA